MRTFVASQRVLSVNLYSYDARTSALSVARCSNQTKALAILNAVTSSSTALSSISCTSSSVTHTWQSTTCKNGKVALCVDCADPCGTQQCPRPLQLNPCGSTVGNAYGCAAPNISVNVYRILTAAYEPFSVPPTFRSIVVTPARYSIAITVGLQSIAKKSVDGTVYCAIFAAGVAPTSVAAIQVQKLFVVTVAGSATIVISTLIPASSYDIYTVGVSPLGAAMAFADVLLSKQSVRTTCCRAVSVSMAMQSLYQFSSSVNSVLVTLDAPPANALTITLRTQSALSPTGNALVPAKITLTSTMRTTSFSNSISSASSGTLGVVSLVATLSGTSASDYVIVFTQRSNFTVISTSQPPPVPQLTSVLFSNDGLYLTAKFDSDTNKGLISSFTFACSKLFSFSGASSAVCVWASASSVRLSLGSVATISVGGVITLAGSTVKAACVSTVSMCAAYPYMALATAVIAAPLVPAVPIVSFFAPFAIGKCDSYTLDLSSSTGGSGRSWKSLSYTVTASSGNVTKVLSFFNSQYKISPPSPVPSGYFPTGLVNIGIKLCNFLGQCGYGSTSLTIADRCVIKPQRAMHSN